jgi:hypothetical protein
VTFFIPPRDYDENRKVSEKNNCWIIYWFSDEVFLEEYLFPCWRFGLLDVYFAKAQSIRESLFQPNKLSY